MASLQWETPGHLRQGGRVLLLVGHMLAGGAFGLAVPAQDSATIRVCSRIEELLEREQLGAMTHLLDSLRPAASVDRDLGLFVACMDAELLRFKGHALERFALLDSVAPAFDHTPDRWKVLFLLGRARAFKDLSLNDEALKDAGQALSLARQRGEKKLLARSMIVKAEIERRMGQYDDMLADLIDAEKLCDTIGYERGKCNVLINWGTMLFGQQRYAEAFDKYKACFEHAMAHRFPSIARNAVLNIGAAAFQLQDFPKAIAVYEEALERNKQLGDRDFEAAVLSNMAVVYNGMKRYDLARTYLERAMGIVRELGDTSAQVYNYNYLATSYWELGLRDSALAATAVTISLSHASHSLELESAGEEKMYDYLKRSGREKEALTHLERHLALKDSLDAVKEGELIHRLEIGYGTEKKERTIQLRDLQLEQERARNRARVVQRNILLGTLVALCIVAFLTYRNISHKRAIAEQQKRISEQRIEQVLTEQELRLVSATMEGQDKERQRVAKDLHDRVGSLLSGVKLQFSALEERMSKLVANGPEHFKKVLDLLDTAVGEVRRISHDLLSSNLAAFGLNSALSDLCDAVHVPGKMDVELSLFGVEERMAKNVEVAAYRIVQEVVSNALKHASATTLSIQVTRVDRQLNILVEDNGRGFDPATARQGMGTGNLHARAAELGGTVHIDSRLGRGTSVSVDIPLG